MKFSYNWIRELIDGLDYAPGPLEKLITMKTAECEGIETAGALLGRACVARVELVEPIPGSHNVKAIVDAGPLGRKTVVCGAPNCRPGLLTAYAQVGMKVIQGVESDGMLASGIELGVNHDHAGILELGAAELGGAELRSAALAAAGAARAEADFSPGAPIRGCAPDSVIEIDNKSITHRPDLWGHHGMAREVAAILGRRLREPAKLDLLPRGPAAIKIQIEDLDLCPRYSALVFDNVTVRPSPLWLQYRLTAIGLNPINNIVDMTNYVMAELAQPMHAFDADLIRGDTIFIRAAKASESFHALNDEQYTLEPTNLAIADASGAIALAGVIGGSGTAISPTTTRVVLESANFQASSIRKTSSAIRLRTDASMRFEKAQDPANTIRGLARAIELLREISPGIRLVGGLADQKKEVPAPPPIELPLEWLERKLGRAIAPNDVRQILERLGFGVSEPASGVFSVTVPGWRATRDISIKDDLVEEVGRMVGYDSIAPKAPLVPAGAPPRNSERAFQHEVRNIFIDQGFTEVYNYSFISEESARAFGLDPAAHLRVANPIASDQELMRASLIPGIWRNIAENARHRDSFRLFEIGLEIHKRSGQTGVPGDSRPAETSLRAVALRPAETLHPPAASDPGRGACSLPSEIPHLVAALYDRNGDGAAGLFEAKRVAECLMPGALAQPAPPRSFEHPARAAVIHWEGQAAGRLFELHPALLESGRAALLDLDLQVIQKLSAGDVKYKPIRRYPSSAFDLSVIAGMREHAGDLEASIRSFAGPLLESVQFLRQYAGPPLPDRARSVSFRLTVGSPERTLSSEEIGEIRARIMERMRRRGYDFRE